MNDQATDERFATDEIRWAALARRDRRADGEFFYAVRTTGVYCRPTCPSRLPKRSNVVFFPSCVEAEQAGFRACRRCRPRDSSMRRQQVEAITRACALIDEAEEALTLKELAAAVGISRFHFHRLFKEIVGVTPREYAATRRIRRLQDDLQHGASVTRAIYEAGFGSSSRVYENAAGMLGMTPSRFRQGGTGLAIRFAITPTFLGCLLVAATDKGICAIEFGNTPEILSERLRARFPEAHLQEGDPEFQTWVAQVTGFLSAPSHGLDLPLDIQGTAFQRRVWKALQAIPSGRTVSYAEVAKSIGRPTAARAVARACAANPLALAIPCHRVVRRDGDLGGYRWGVERKQALLERETAATSAADGDACRPDRID